MSMIIAHNNMAVNTQRNLGVANRGVSGAMERLSSGYRINTGKDGPADLVISEQLRAQNAGLERALRNTNEALNVMSIAEGAMNEMNNILKKMKQLALHVANSGVTSASQAAADQAEMDSGLDTLNRIANSTRYSDMQLLNGAKEIAFKNSTTINNTTNNSLINTTKSQITQAANLSSTLTVSFSGVNTVGTNAEAVQNNVAKKAYFDADVQAATLQANVEFNLTGSIGTKHYQFKQGAGLGDVAKSINADAASTGVNAQLVFGSETTAKLTDVAANATMHMDGNWQAKTVAGVAGTASVAAFGATTTIVGKNTDADGAIYISVVDAAAGIAIAYKDAEMTMEVGRYDGGTLTASNNSGLEDGALTIGNATNGDIIRVQAGTASLGFTTDGADTDEAYTIDNNNVIGAMGDTEYLSGVRLGENTDVNGNLYVEIKELTNGSFVMNVYNDAEMGEKSLVASSHEMAAATDTFNLFAVNSTDGKASSGIYGALTGVATGTAVLQAQNLGLRISSTEYGDSAKVSIDMKQGTLFADEDGRLISASQTATSYGQSATVSVNGKEMKVGNDFKISYTSSSINADVQLNAGKLGATTIAIQGYTDGAYASRALSLLANSGTEFESDVAAGTGDDENGSYSTQARNNTTSTMSKLDNGAKLQLGESGGYYESAVVGIRNMSLENLGVTTFETFDGTMKRTETLSLADLRSGNAAELSSDPTKALAIIEAAINDIASTRAQIGAVQSNMLQTNVNNLGVAIENIQKTESAIRDTDMATEMTEFTKNQVLQNAAMSMLAQANAQSQSALQLLG